MCAVWGYISYKSFMGLEGLPHGHPKVFKINNPQPIYTDLYLLKCNIPKKIFYLGNINLPKYSLINVHDYLFIHFL